jgi:hypothetical protein
MMPSSYRGSIEFRRVARNFEWKAADNAETVRGFLAELPPCTRAFCSVEDNGWELNVSFRREQRNESNGVKIIDQITNGVPVLIHVLDLIRTATERALRQHRGLERIEIAVENVGRRRRRHARAQILHHLIRLQHI